MNKFLDTWIHTIQQRRNYFENAHNGNNIEKLVKILPTKKSPKVDGFTEDFCKNLRDNNDNHSQTL